MLSLRTIGTWANETTITLRGAQVKVRGLTCDERDRIMRLYPKPFPPIGKDPDKGDLAPEVPLPNDPGYLTGLTERAARMVMLQAAIAVGWETESGGVWDPAMTDTQALAYARESGHEMAKAMSQSHVDRIVDAAAMLETGTCVGDRGGERGGDPRKNC